MRVDAQIMVLNCPACQHHAPEHHQPTNLMIPITSPWPFEQWGTDIIGPFPRAPGNFAYAVVAVDYFTKWVETELLRSITGSAVQKFFWKSVVCCFGLSRVVISDNGRQFVDNPFKAWCENLGIKQHFTSVGHPQANGQAENFNRTLPMASKLDCIEPERPGWRSSPACCGLTGLPRGQQHRRPRSL
ncbi:uncharacterized protein K02A2.6-like [Coffea eugenioides]|uniref:uncharacterized protein K02A2.6-like n=1 Tax=Coffea eugenioides TaxID=49369 RepID=UPI000F6048D3|nr:uncharacterized protein K02A2.6-like [Coffea eugenioides]